METVLAVVFWGVLVVLLLVVLVWWWWLRRDQRRYLEYLHRAGEMKIPTPYGRLAVPSDDQLRAALKELNLPTQGNPDAKSSEEEGPSQAE